MTVLGTEVEVQNELKSMGIPITALTKALMAGAGGFNSTTDFHTISSPGTYLYHETTAGVRRGLVPIGFEYDEEDRQARTYSASRGMSIVVQTGDENTGIDTGVEPKPRNPKGPATLKKVTSNSEQLALFNLTSEPAPKSADGFLTWILLVAIIGDKVRGELSLPRAWSSDGKPCGWHVRILLPEQDLSGGNRIDVSDSVAADVDTSIDVQWKQ